MVTFTSSEKIAILSLLKAMVLVDGKVHDMEESMMIAVMQTFNITEEESIISDSLQTVDAAKVIANASPEKKNIVCGLLGTMMTVDMDIDSRENALWSTISMICGFPEMNVADAMKSTREFFELD